MARYNKTWGPHAHILPTLYAVVLFMFSELRRCDYSICWYCWYCWL